MERRDPNSQRGWRYAAQVLFALTEGRVGFLRTDGESLPTKLCGNARAPVAINIKARTRVICSGCGRAVSLDEIRVQSRRVFCERCLPK